MSKSAIVIIIVVIVIVIVGLAYLASQSPPETEEPTAEEQACLDAGGTVSTMLCCETAGDFPNLCVVGACGCAPDNSVETKVCDCGEGECFDGTSCQLIEPEAREDEACLGSEGGSMFLTEAQALAQESSCLEEGLLGEGGFCNSNTGTWWLDFEPTEPKEGCNPACVVDIETEEAEINWRCTGLIPEE